MNDLEILGNAHNLELKAQKWRKEIGIPELHKVFLFAGKFESKKDPLLLIHSFKKLREIHSDIHLVLVGNGELQQDVESEVFTTSISKIKSAQSAISILPFQNQSIMPVVYRLADVFVLPSQGPGETWGLAVNEAMASGKPVIVSDKCGCAQELVVQGVNGYTFKSGIAQDLITKMQLLLDRTDLKSMGESSKQIISTFNYSTFAEALDQCFAKLKM